MSNRILLSLCDCQRRRRREQRLQETVESLDYIADGIIQLHHDGRSILATVYFACEPIGVDNAAEILAAEVRDVIRQLDFVAARLEGGRA